MKILLTGATGYIAKRLLPVLLYEGHTVVCCVRDAKRFNPTVLPKQNIEVIEVDFLDRESLDRIPSDIDIAYYLIHSMSGSDDFKKLELACTENFIDAVKDCNLRQCIYLSGIVNEKALSKHLASRKAVEDKLSTGSFHLTTLRAGIIIGSGSASFEIIRDLVEKLPFMVTPKWLNTKCQPIGITNVIQILLRILDLKETYDQSFDIGCNDVLSYKEMLKGYAEARDLKRFILTVPVMTPKISSYWLYFITSTSFRLASALVNSMKIEVICKNNELIKMLGIQPLSYKESIKRSLEKIEKHEVISSWKDSFVSGRFKKLRLTDYIDVPKYGCFVDKRGKQLVDRDHTLSKIWRIGGKTGWYFGNWLWQIRGFLDKLFGGVGLRRGRTHYDKLSTGDAIDFWRVLYANKEEGRLLLFAEMKLPGEAWLEFKIKDNSLYQTATFRPKGIFGRLYWYSVYPMHEIVFRGLINQLIKV